MTVLVDKDRADEILIQTFLRLKAKLRSATEISPYRADPVGWINTRLGEHLWSKQREIATAVQQHRRTAVHSAHDTGKSWLAARIVAWWLDVHPPGEAFVVTTAPTGDQVRAILWREINHAFRKGNLPGRTNQTEWWINEELVAFGRKPADYAPTAFQGIHARYVLVVIDEACGVPDTIYKAAGSLAANEHSRILAIGNPDDPQSHFAVICRPGSGWHVIQVDGLKSPNFTHGTGLDDDLPDELRDLLLSKTYERELADEVGEQDGLYISKIRGQFPEDKADGVVLLSWARRCQELDLTPNDNQVELGVDVGAGGDETSIRERRGPVAGRAWHRKTPDWADGVAMVLDAIDETGARRVKVDMIGIGWGIVGRLKELRDEGRHNAEIIGVNVGSASTDPTRFPKLRDQLWWEVGRELSRTKGWDLKAVNDVTLGQLTAPTFKRDSAGRIQIEKKEDTRKRLKRSPDDADALLLAYAQLDDMYLRELDEDLASELTDFRGY